MVLPDTHLAALRWLGEHGGEGVLDRYGALVAGGSRLSAGKAQVLLRLFTTGHLISAGKNRIALSDSGRALQQPHGHFAAPSQFTGRRSRAPMLDEESV